MQAAPQRGDLQLLSLLTATPFTRSFYAKNSSLLHLLILQRSPHKPHFLSFHGLFEEFSPCRVTLTLDYRPAVR